MRGLVNVRLWAPTDLTVHMRLPLSSTSTRTLPRTISNVINLTQIIKVKETERHMVVHENLDE